MKSEIRLPWTRPKTIAVIICALVSFAIYLTIEMWPIPPEESICPADYVQLPKCDCDSPIVLEGIGKYEDLDIYFGPRDAAGAKVIETAGPCVRVNGSLSSYHFKSGHSLRLSSGVLIGVDPTVDRQSGPYDEEPGVVLEGRLVRTWYPPFQGTLPGWSRESRRRSKTRNYLQARPVGYLYRLVHFKRVLATEAPSESQRQVCFGLATIRSK